MKTIPLIRNTPIDDLRFQQGLFKPIALTTAHYVKIAFPTSKGLEFLHPEDITFARSAGNYTQVSTTLGTALLVSKMISLLEIQLSQSTFIRIHHQYLINTQHLIRYEKGDGGLVHLTNGVILPVSRDKKKQFLKMVCGGGCEE